VRPEAGATFSQLALGPDRAAERAGERDAEEDLEPGKIGHC
jgi:hypothetical protein